MEISNENKNIIVKKSNTLIQSIGKTTLLSNKVFLTALLTVEKREKCPVELKSYYKSLENVCGADFSTGMVAEFSNSVMRNFMTKSGSYYKTIEDLMDSNSPDSLKKQWGIMINRPEDGLYGFVDVITAMLYDAKNGKLFVKFSDEKRIQKEIYNLKRNYTSLSYELMMTFRSVYSYRIYEIIMSRIGYDDGSTHSKKLQYQYDYGLSELKYYLGILDPYITPDVKRAISEAKTPEDFERIEASISTEHKMPRYNDFEKYTLKKAISEINDIKNAEYRFSYSPIRNGRGGKVTGVLFTIDRLVKENENMNESPKLSDDDKDEIIDSIRDMITEKLKTKDIRSIAEAAGYDLEKIRKAYSVAEATPKKIDNLVGFMVSAIKGGYEAPVTKENNKRKNAFVDNFEQRDTDYDEIIQKQLEERFK